VTVQSQRRGGGGYLERPAPSGLADVIVIILDKTTGAVKGVKKALTGGDDNERRPAKKSSSRRRQSEDA